MGRLGHRQIEALGQEHERVKEAARQRDVVVDDQQPVEPVERARARAADRDSRTCRARRPASTRTGPRDASDNSSVRAAASTFGASSRSTASASTRRRGHRRGRSPHAPRLRASRAPRRRTRRPPTVAREVARIPHTWPDVPDRKSSPPASGIGARHHRGAARSAGRRPLRGFAQRSARREPHRSSSGAGIRARRIRRASAAHSPSTAATPCARRSGAPRDPGHRPPRQVCGGGCRRPSGDGRVRRRPR